MAASALGDIFVSSSIYLSLTCYSIVVVVKVACGGAEEQSVDSCTRWNRGGRILPWIWLAGVMFFWLHAAAAFHFVHHWRHAEAVEHTARRSLEVVGWEFGGGVYFNYLFGVLWTVHAVFGLAKGLAKPSEKPNLTHRRVALHWASAFVHVYLAFIVINGAIVFERGLPRAVGMVVFVGLTLMVLFRSRTGR